MREELYNVFVWMGNEQPSFYVQSSSLNLQFIMQDQTNIRAIDIKRTIKPSNDEILLIGNKIFDRIFPSILCFFLSVLLFNPIFYTTIKFFIHYHYYYYYIIHHSIVPLNGPSFLIHINKINSYKTVQYTYRIDTHELLTN